jgi:autotransporter-associated beta strand protein
MSLHASDGTSNTDLVFEYDNTDAYTLNLSKVGTGNNQVANNDFVTTLTYYDGSSGLDASDGGHIFSGLSGSGNITLGDDGSDVYTLHVNGANNSSTFSGNLYNSSGEAADSTIIKTGSGEQIITGSFKVGDSATAGLVIQDGKITFAGPGSSGGIVPQLQSITSASGGSPVLELNNTSSGASELVTIGLSETGSADFGGSVVLNGSGSETKIRVTATSPTYTAADYNRTQVFSGVVSSTASNKLVKTGVGELELSGNNTFTGGVEIEAGTVIAGHANALGSSNTVTINKGKLEVDNGVTLAPTTITAGDSHKTMIGGRGTLDKAVTIGSGNGQVDVISPGDGISSSLSSSTSQQQVSIGDRGNAIGTFTVSDTLTLENGGVYDWEISDFTGSAGSDWDLLKFDTLNFDSTSDVFTINIMSLESNGSAGSMSGGNVWQHYNSNGFKFMEATGSGSGWTGTGSMGSSGLVSAFTVDDRGWSYYNNHHLHNWNVWYDGSGSFYLQYSVAPEPSTYVMVTGLMLVPGMNAVRKYRNRKKKQGVEEPEEEIVS